MCYPRTYASSWAASLLRESLPASAGSDPVANTRSAGSDPVANTRSARSPDYEEVAEWLESSDEERGATLRGLLRLGDAIVRARGTPAPRRDAPFPRIDSTAAGGA
jgi:hypothetical protein